LKSINKYLKVPGRVTLAGAPEGFDALVLAACLRQASGRDVLHVARDDARLARLAEALAFFAPELPVLTMPAWD
jgi:transcription-repair coupling factor (superfamily II helicase)